ncbi:MOCS2 family protein [Megaselia abdita]
MAIKEMTTICDEIRSKWADVGNIAIYHRLGLVPVKEASVVIAISSPHRKTSLESVAFAIDELKRRVPIWKKEKYSDDCSTWKENQEWPKRIKLSKNLEDIKIEKSGIPKSLIQISADESEIQRRIKCFVEKKREQNNHNNILDFTKHSNEEENPNSCARVDAVFHKQPNGKGHLKIHRVKNAFGPQTRPDYVDHLDKLMGSSGKSAIKNEPVDRTSIPFGIRERLDNSEKYLEIKPTSTSVYERLKKIEERILYLETVSPEYKHFLNPNVGRKNKPFPGFKKKTYSNDDIDDLIANINAGIN